ncbi:IclR family transcriptional regulator [Brevundimonas fontaquae]|uniref:Helix-turn-helix domain-containing protein n=1 Tax=Brevundimonas fontaquae TaxID=2813778 RepID=A0ABX7LLI2_9CAUL|nr:helix-turn-helix domain-containing protein [Brevundimonas fontaquae]QSF52812.1 helix-turn-helix domain-containing protein [Brevundimonas fontaquae]
MTDQDAADDRKYRAPALEKGLDVLELLSSQGEAMTPSQMSVTLGRSVSELFRMIQVLEFRGYIEQSSEGYRLTNRLFTLGMTQAPIKSLVDVAMPAMRDLASSTMQSCHLVVPSGDQIVVIARIESPGDLGYSVRIGYRRSILHATSGLMFYSRANALAQKQLHDTLAAQFGQPAVEAFVERSLAMTQGPYVERASDFVKGVTDLVAPVMGSDGVIATLITPFIEQAPLTCTKDEAAALLARAAEVISDQMSAVSQA